MKPILILNAASLTAAHLAQTESSSCSETTGIPTCGISCISSAASAIGCGTADYA
ncbi:hypothetical protein diail_10020, partial [Diaporthe ilicicola]